MRGESIRGGGIRKFFLIPCLPQGKSETVSLPSVDYGLYGTIVASLL